MTDLPPRDDAHPSPVSEILQLVLEDRAEIVQARQIGAEIAGDLTVAQAHFRAAFCIAASQAERAGDTARSNLLAAAAKHPTPDTIHAAVDAAWGQPYRLALLEGLAAVGTAVSADAIQGA